MSDKKLIWLSIGTLAYLIFNEVTGKGNDLETLCFLNFIWLFGYIVDDNAARSKKKRDKEAQDD